MPPGEASTYPAAAAAAAADARELPRAVRALGMGRYLAQQRCCLAVRSDAALARCSTSMAGYAFAKLRFRGPRRALPAAARRAGDPGAGRDAAAVPDAQAAWASSTRYGGVIVPGAGEHLRHLPGAAVRARDPRRPARRRAHRRRRRVPHLLTDRAAAAHADPRDARDLHLPRHVERLHVAADRADRRATLYTLPVALANLSREHVQDNELMMAGSVLTVLPVLRAVPALQRYYIAGPAGGQREGMSDARCRARAGAVPRRRSSRAAARADAAVLDDFEDRRPLDGGRVRRRQASLRTGDGDRRPARCASTSTSAGVAGYVVARRDAAARRFRRNYEFALACAATRRRTTSSSSWSTRAATTSGGSNRPQLRVPARRGTTVRFKQRQIEFAWGPTQDRALRRSAAIEFVIAPGSGGGKGASGSSGSTLRELPARRGDAARRGDGSSALPGTTPRLPSTARRDRLAARPPRRGSRADRRPRRPREFGGLVARWGPARRASRYDVELSDDGERWRDVRRVDRAAATARLHCAARGRGALRAPALDEPAAEVVALAELELRAARSTPNAFFAELARERRAAAIRAASAASSRTGRSSASTAARAASLLNEDGALEVGKRRQRDRALRGRRRQRR